MFDVCCELLSLGSGRGDERGQRFKNHGVAPKSAADFAFLLHGLHYLKDDGVMAIILPHGVPRIALLPDR